MAAALYGNKIVFSNTGDKLELNCPIKRITFAGGPPLSVIVDGVVLYFTNNYSYGFPSLHGYPGSVCQVQGEIAAPSSLVIEEIGDVLNPNYFKEDIRNWNGQGAASSVSEDTPKARSRAKKAEVTE